MLDISFLRENPEEVKDGVTKKGYDPSLVDKVLELDKKRVELLQKVDELRGERNKISEERTAGSEQRGREIKEELKELEPQLNKIEEQYNLALREIPNLPLSDVPVGEDESKNKVLRKWGEPKKFPFAPKDHLELGQLLRVIDVQRASKVSGARFGYLLGDAVLLEFALVQLAIKTLTKNGFTPIVPPALTRVSVFQNLGYSEHGGNEGYYLVYDPKKENPEEESNYYLIGTAEHGIVPYFMDEVLRATDLPKRFVGFSSAFRREAGSYGKDTHGIFRVHQFDKVEMVSFTKLGDDKKELEQLLSLQEELFQALKIPYQVVQMCTGDLGHPAAAKFDLEAWLPGEERYREVTSVSTTTDYQARRLNIKYLPAGRQVANGGISRFVHILNGTAFAIGRTIIAILENYQQKDGSVNIPEVLRPFIGKDKITP